MGKSMVVQRKNSYPKSKSIKVVANSALFDFLVQAEVDLFNCLIARSETNIKIIESKLTMSSILNTLSDVIIASTEFSHRLVVCEILWRFNRRKHYNEIEEYFHNDDDNDKDNNNDNDNDKDNDNQNNKKNNKNTQQE